LAVGFRIDAALDVAVDLSGAVGVFLHA
jgi:hypothetical protein